MQPLKPEAWGTRLVFNQFGINANNYLNEITLTACEY